MGRSKFSTRKRWLKKSEKNNATFARNVLYNKNENIYPAYVSQHKLNCEKQVILLMTPNGLGRKAKSEEQQWHYLVVKDLLALSREVTSKNNGDFYYLNCRHSFKTNKKLESHKKFMRIKIFITELCLLKTLKY